MSFVRELEKPRRGRIHDLATRQTEREKPVLEFNVEEYVGDREWEILSTLAREYLAEDSLYQVKGVRLAAKMKFIDPKRFAALESGMHSLIETNVHKHILSSDFNSSSWCIETLSVLYPEKLKEWLSPKRLGVIEERFSRYRRTKNWTSFAEEGSYMKLANQPLWPMTISEYVWSEMKKTLKELHYEKKIGSFLSMATSMKVLEPYRVDELGITPEILDNLLSTLKRSQKDLEKSDGEVFASYVEWMVILAAEKVEMTDHGIEVTMPKRNEHRENITKRPVRSTL